MTEQKLEFTKRFLVLGNLGLIAWILLAFYAVFLYNQVYGWLYLLATTFLVYVLLRRLGCSSCYRCKTCTSGFGRLAGVFFGRGFVKKESVGNRWGWVALVYLLLLVLPFLVLAVLFGDGVSFVEVLLLACLLFVALASLVSWRRT